MQPNLGMRMVEVKTQDKKTHHSKQIELLTLFNPLTHTLENFKAIGAHHECFQD